jgi:uncharacterized protein
MLTYHNNTGVHIHIAIANRNRKTIGGHLTDGCFIYTNDDFGSGVSEEFRFFRTMDAQIGYLELEIDFDR